MQASGVRLLTTDQQDIGMLDGKHMLQLALYTTIAY